MEQLVSFFKDKVIATVLDVGTGPGNFIPVLSESLPNARIIGVDPNGESLEEASVAYPDASFCKMVGENLDFADNTFDTASISMALHHLPDVLKTLNEMQRVVKRGGFIIVNELFSDNLNPAQEVHKKMHHFRSTIDRLKGVSHHETFTKQEILELVEKSGLEILLHFENRTERKQPSSEEITERIGKMNDMLEEIIDRPEYHVLAKESRNITEVLNKYGFEMATRVIVVAKIV